MNGVPDYFQEYLENQQYADPDATYYDWMNDPVYFPGGEGRPDLEMQGDMRVPVTSFPQKIVDALTSTPKSFVVTALMILAVLFAMRA